MIGALRFHHEVLKAEQEQKRDMNADVHTEQSGGVAIVRVGDARLMYPMLADFSAAVNTLVASGKRDIVIDLTPVTYVDSATIGCFMDLYRQVHNAGGHLKLSGVQKRVETMLTMTGAQNFIEIHADEPSAVKSFGA
jgi:anti-anti-sigma factor